MVAFAASTRDLHASFNAREVYHTFDVHNRLTGQVLAGTRVEDDFSSGVPAAYSVVSGTWAVSGEVLSETTATTGRILRDLAEDTTEVTFSFKSPHDAEDDTDFDPERYGLFIVRLFESTWRYAALVIEPTGLYLREWDDDVLVGQLDSEAAAFQADTWYDVKVAYSGTDRRTITVNWAKRGDPMPTSTTFTATLSANLAEDTDQQTGFGTGEIGEYSYRDVQFRDVSSTSSTMTSTYIYDALGRRVGKTTDLDTTPVAVQYIYDGGQIVEERDGSGNLNASYVYGPRIDEPITTTRGANTYYYHQDDQGNVVALTDGSAAVAERYTYGPFGDPSIFEADGTTPRTTSIAANPFLFTGREWDPELSAYWYRTRNYDPKAGRFINRDTIGLWGDAANLGNPYSYVNNNPWSGTDPYGQWGWDQDWFETALNVLGGGFFSGSGGAAMHSFWVVSGGEQLSEMASGVAAMGSASAWSGAYNTAVEDTAARYEQRIVMHQSVNGGDVNEAIGTATGWRMVGADIVGFTSMGEARNRLDYTTGAPLTGIERVQRGLTGVSQFTGSVAFIGGTGSNLAQGYKGVGLPRSAPRTQTASVATRTAAEADAAALRPYGGPGGGHHVPAKKAFESAAGYDPNAALAIPNAEMARLGVDHLRLVTPAQRALYSAYARTGAPLTWEAMEAIETQALIRGGMQPGMARATVQQVIQSLKNTGVAGPTRIPWDGQ